MFFSRIWGNSDIPNTHFILQCQTTGSKAHLMPNGKKTSFSWCRIRVTGSYNGQQWKAICRTKHCEVQLSYFNKFIAIFFNTTQQIQVYTNTFLFNSRKIHVSLYSGCHISHVLWGTWMKGRYHSVVVFLCIEQWIDKLMN